jgi:subtilisin family serine protease
MKRKVFATLMISVIVLASCSKKEEPVFLTAHPTTNEDDYAAYDYSDHTDSREAAYTTVLADLSVLAKGEPALAKKELPASWLGRPFEGLETKNDVFGYDARSCDISDVDLSAVEDTDDLTFDTDTKWPKVLPKGFDPEKILEFNKNPGLGIRALHKKGITGKGVSIAIIDQGLLLEHEQYKNNIKLYERIHCGDDVAQMHGPAVASIAAGMTSVSLRRLIYIILPRPLVILPTQTSNLMLQLWQMPFSGYWISMKSWIRIKRSEPSRYQRVTAEWIRAMMSSRLPSRRLTKRMSLW